DFRPRIVRKRRRFPRVLAEAVEIFWRRLATRLTELLSRSQQWGYSGAGGGGGNRTRSRVHEKQRWRATFAECGCQFVALSRFRFPWSPLQSPGVNPSLGDILETGSEWASAPTWRSPRDHSVAAGHNTATTSCSGYRIGTSTGISS